MLTGVAYDDFEVAVDGRRVFNKNLGKFSEAIHELRMFQQ